MPMFFRIRMRIPARTAATVNQWIRSVGGLLVLIFLIPLTVHAQSGSPFDTGFTNMQTLFTGTVAKVASLIAIVIGGYQFAHGEPGAKKALAGVAAGTGIAVMATNVLSWLWGS
jgi:type IV secretory pathway VirB2 component (pilin)